MSFCRDDINLEYLNIDNSKNVDIFSHDGVMRLSHDDDDDDKLIGEGTDEDDSLLVVYGDNDSIASF